jgi:hypothetical protein
MHSVSRRSLSFAIVATAAFLAASAVPRAAAQGGEPQSFAIRGATVVPVSGPRIENATVLVSRGVITGVGKDVTFPQETWIIDGKGLTVYPGLFDSFTDVGLGSSAPPAGGEAAGRPQQRAVRKIVPARLPGATPPVKRPLPTSASRRGAAPDLPPSSPQIRAASFPARPRSSILPANATAIWL